jgi:hypothetical protein
VFNPKGNSMTQTTEEFARCRRAMYGPAWRAMMADRMEIPPGSRLLDVLDETLIDYGKYRRLKGPDGEGAERAAKAYPRFAAAEHLNEDSDKSAMLKMMVLADMPDDELLTRSGVEVEVLKIWERLFFDARTQHKATDWLAHQVVNREAKSGNPELAAKLRMAIVGGPVAVRGMLDMVTDVSLDEADRLFQRRLKLSMKLDMAANMPIETDKQRMFFMNLHIDLMGQEQRIALAEQKLTQRCAEARDRFELAKMRMEQAAEFRAIRLSEKQRKAEQREFRRADQRQAEQEVGRYQAAAERKAMECRIAESSLAKLRWGAAASVAPVIATKVTPNNTNKSRQSEAMDLMVDALVDEDLMFVGVTEHIDVGADEERLVAAF